MIGKLGKKAPRLDTRTLLFAHYAGGLPAPPAVVDWAKAVPIWGVMKNDVIGDCACAAVGHLIQSWSANAKPPELTLSDDAIVEFYKAVSGYDGQADTDHGADELSVLKYWAAQPVGGVQLSAFTALDWTDDVHVRQATDLFGGVYCGLNLPACLKETGMGPVWDVPASGPTGTGTPGSLGGHAVILVGYDADSLSCVTWGFVQRMTWNFWHTYVDEAYALLSREWIEGCGKAPSGFDFEALDRDLSLVRK